MKTVEEHIARKLCEYYEINPDQKSVGLGRAMPEGHEYYLWEVQAKVVKLVLDEFEKTKVYNNKRQDALQALADADQEYDLI